jgi:ketosteroid isomerase-like protein
MNRVESLAAACCQTASDSTHDQKINLSIRRNSMNTKRIFSLLTILSLTSILLLAACAPAAPAKDMSKPVTVVQTFYEILNTKDVPKAMELTAEEYVMNDPFGTYDRTAAAVQWQAVVDAGITFNQTEFVDTGNGRVTSCYEVLENGNSVDKGCGNVTHVRGGKIIFDGLEAAEQIWIVQEFYEAFNANEIERGMSLTAEDYVMNDPFGTYDRDAAALQWQAVRDAGITFNQTDFVNTGNGRVTSCYEVLENGTSVDKGCGNVTHVRDGKIIFDGLEAAEQIWIVQEYYEALNAKNLDLAMTFITSDAIFINPTGSYEGAEAIRESLAGLNTEGISFNLSNFRNMAGSVVYDYEVLQSGNLLDRGTNGLTIVKDGMIVFDGTEDTSPLATTDPAAVVQDFWAAIDAKDVDAAMDLLADNALCRGSCYFSGKATFLSVLQGTINSGTFKITDLQIEGDQVTYTLEYFRNGALQATGSEAMQVQDGKIILWEVSSL